MFNKKIAVFLLCVAIAHVLLFALSFIFLGLGATLLLSICGSAVWIIYCSCKESPLHFEDDEASSEASSAKADVDAPSLPMAVIGGPWCWLLSPTCLIPFSYAKAMELGFGWDLACKILRAFCRSVLKLLGYLYDYAADVYTRALAGASKGRQ
jgi:hypothetical protein